MLHIPSQVYTAVCRKVIKKMPATTLEGIVGSFQVTDPWPQDFREICENINVRKRPRHSYFINLFCWQDWLLIMNLMKNKQKKEQTDPSEWWLFYCFVHLVFTCMLNISPQFFSCFLTTYPDYLSRMSCAPFPF